MQIRAYPKNYWKDLGVLLIIYSLMQFFYYLPESALPEAIKKLRISPLWFFLAIAYLTGSGIVKKWNIAWLLLIWQAVHKSLVGLFMIKAAYASLVGPLPIGIESIFRPVIEFLMSPLLYMVLGLVYRSMR